MAGYHEQWLDGTVEINVEEALSISPESIAKERVEEVCLMLRLLRAGRDSDNADLRSRPAMRLRKTYLTLLAGYRSYSIRFEKGLDLPDWIKVDDVPVRPTPKGIETWSLEDFVAEEIPAAHERAARHAALVEAIANASPSDMRGVGRRRLKKELNSLMALIGKEVEYLDWTFG